jgi:hypothetical protein
MTSTGMREATVDWTLPPGTYWMSMVVQGNVTGLTIGGGATKTWQGHYTSANLTSTTTLGTNWNITGQTGAMTGTMIAAFMIPADAKSFLMAMRAAA